MKRRRERELTAEVAALRLALARAEDACTYWRAGMCTSLAQCVQATHQVEQARRVLDADRIRLEGES